MPSLNVACRIFMSYSNGDVKFAFCSKMTAVIGMVTLASDDVFAASPFNDDIPIEAAKVE